VSVAEQASLVETIAGVEFANFEMRGVVARRRVAFFGATYDAGDATVQPMPEFLRPLIERAAAWAGPPTGGRRTATHDIVLAPRSAYLMTGESRGGYVHSIPPVPELRYSLTFRTLRPGRALRLPRPGR
jgi:hypothetical protein